MNLEEARQEIALIDREMAALFEKRLRAGAVIAEWKKERGLPVRDAVQEAKVLDRNVKLLEDADKRGIYLNFMRDVMRYTRQYEHRLIEGARVAYSGVEGAFAQIAASRIFPGARLFPCTSFEEAYSAVVRGDCESAVLPIENSYAGEVGLVMDLMFEGPLYVNGVYDMAVDQCLLGTQDASLEGIRTVISHPQALNQCRVYLAGHGMETVEASNTAVAAQTVAEKGDPSLAAIASAGAASLYGLKILDPSINESRANTTRFAVFSPVETGRHDPGSAFLLLFTVSDEAGSLAKAVNVISGRGFNMRVLRSRPMKRLPWHYYFYAEVLGDDDSEEGRQLLEELKTVCKTVKIAGRYTSADDVLQGGESI